jgi:hypothetical protein
MAGNEQAKIASPDVRGLVLLSGVHLDAFAALERIYMVFNFHGQNTR